MSFHSPGVFPLVSYRSVWHNGKQPLYPLKVPRLQARNNYCGHQFLCSHDELCAQLRDVYASRRCAFNFIILFFCVSWLTGLIEHFRDKCGGVPRWLDKKTSYIAFQEGWALYAESPLLAQDANLYEQNYLQLYGMFKWQVCVISKEDIWLLSQNKQQLSFSTNHSDILVVWFKIGKIRQVFWKAFRDASLSSDRMAVPRIDSENCPSKQLTHSLSSLRVPGHI